MSGYSGSNSSSSTAASQSTQAFDIAMNAAPSGAVGGSLLNLNLAGLTLKNTGSKTKSRTGDTALGGGKSGKAVADSSGSNSGVQLNFLDNQAISRAFDFASKVSTDAKESFTDALGRVANANSTAKATPADEQIRLAIMLTIGAVALFFVFGMFRK